MAVGLGQNQFLFSFMIDEASGQLGMHSRVRGYVFAAIPPLAADNHIRNCAPTEMALTSGCSVKPNPQLWVKLPASRHKLAHGLWNSMVVVARH